MLKEMKNLWRSFPCNGWQIFCAIVIVLLIAVIVVTGILYFFDKFGEKREKEHSAYITTHLNEFKGKHKIAHLGETIVLSDKIYLMFTTSNSHGLSLKIVDNGKESWNLLYGNYRGDKSNLIIKIERGRGYGYYGYIVLEEISIKFHILLANEKMLLYSVEPLTK